MSRYNIRIKTAQSDFIPVEQFTNKYPSASAKIDLIDKYLVNISDVATPEQMKKFSNDFGISQDNYVKIITSGKDTFFSDILTLSIPGTEDKRRRVGHILKSDVANKYFGVNDKYVKLVPVSALSPVLQETIGFIPGRRKFSFLIPYTGENEDLKKIYDEKRGKFPGLSNYQWYELIQKPRLLKQWVDDGNDPSDFKDPSANYQFSHSLFKTKNLNDRLLTQNYSKEQIASMNMQQKVDALQSQIDQQLEQFYLYGKLLADVRTEKIPYDGNDPESLPDDVRRFGATESQWSDLISNRHKNSKLVDSKFKTPAFTNLSIEEKSRVISDMWDTGFVPSKQKPKFAYTGNDPKTIEKLKEYGLYGKEIDVDDLTRVGYISDDNLRQRKSRNNWTKKINEYVNAVMSNAPNKDQLRNQLQEIWNEILIYSSNKSKMDQTLYDTLSPLNKTLESQGITLRDEQNIYVQYQAGNTTKNVQLRFDYLIRKNGKIILAIENQGDQHYVPLTTYKQANSETVLQKWLAEKLRDKLKLDFCHDHNIPLLYISGYLNDVEYRKIAENLAKDINYYVSLIPEGQQIETLGENRKNPYVARESNDLDFELKKYADRIVVSHFSELKQPLYADIEPNRIEAMIHDKKILLSNLLAIYASNFKVDGYDNLDYIKSVSGTTDLSQYYRYIDAACARFGYADNQLGRMIEQISFNDRIGKRKYKLPDISTVVEPVEPVETKPVQEMSLKRHKKKKYKIKRLF